MFDYFYGAQSEQFAFYRVPKVLFTNEMFKCLSAEAKTLYGILLDRVPLSAKNGWIDEQGRVYIICTIEEIMDDMSCGNKKAGQMLADLETKVALIERKRQGLGKPNLIYVKNFISVDTPVRRHVLKCQNDTSRSAESPSLEMSNGHGTNTDLNQTKDSDTDSIFHSEDDRRMDGRNNYQKYYDYFSEHLNISQLKKDYPYDTDILDNILDLIVETVCSKKTMIRIAAEDRPAEVVRNRFMKLDSEHIRYVVDCFKENTTKIKDVRQYMLTTIYNAPITIDMYYDALARHDMATNNKNRNFKM